MRDFCFQYQENVKPAKWDAQFQAYGIDGRAVLEALKKLMAYTVFWGNGPETDYLRCLAQHNPSLKEKFNMRQYTRRQSQKEGIPTTKDIAEAFCYRAGNR